MLPAMKRGAFLLPVLFALSAGVAALSPPPRASREAAAAAWQALGLQARPSRDLVLLYVRPGLRAPGAAVATARWRPRSGRAGSAAGRRRVSSPGA
jgi:hypothetical protein